MLTLQTEQIKRLREAARAPIGIDIGTHSVRAVQLRNRPSGSVAVWTDVIPLTGPDLDSSREQALAALQSRIHESAACSCLLPLSLNELKVAELHAAPAEAQFQMAVADITATYGTEVPRETSVIPLLPPASSDDREQVMLITVPSNSAMSVAKRLQSSRITVSSLPCSPAVAAEAARMQSPEAEMSLCIDIGETATRMTFVRDGLPVHYRVLERSGLTRLTTHMSRVWRIGPASARDLLLYRSSAEESTPRSLRSHIARHVESHLCDLLDAVSETVQYIERHTRGMRPDSVVLCGSGAMIPELPELLSEELNIECREWLLPGDRTRGTLPLRSDMAFAAALSSLCSRDAEHQKKKVNP